MAFEVAQPFVHVRAVQLIGGPDAARLFEPAVEAPEIAAVMIHGLAAEAPVARVLHKVVQEIHERSHG